MTECVINIENLYKRFDAENVLKGVSATVEKGDVIGLLGLNGAGKTTLLEALLGFTLPDNGQCRLWSRDIATSEFNTVKSRIGFVPQQDELLDTVDGNQYLKLIASFYPTWNPALVNRLASEWAVPMGTRIGKLSVGQRQKLSILAALGHEPELIILDEPVASLDPLARRQFLKELVDIAAGQDRTVLFSTHIVSDLERVASRVWLIKDGHIVVDEALDALKEYNARITLPPGAVLPTSFLAGHGLHARKVLGAQTVFAPAFSDQVRQAVEHQIGQAVTVEALSLEDLFLEMHA